MRDMVAVIMAGGVGQRFWPLSTEGRPKQFLDIEGTGRSLLQATFDRSVCVAGAADRVLVVTVSRYAGLVREQLPGLPAANLLLEPTARDTGPAVALAMLEVERRHGDAIAGVFPADHRVSDVAAFAAAVRGAAALAERESVLVTLGIAPDRPATGFGYIERGEEVPGGYRVARFVEKPPLEQAQGYVASGRHSWNAGIFVWPVAVILDELRRHAPAVINPLESLPQARMREVFSSLPKISIDYAVMEKTERACVVTAAFGWDDLGDWGALERLRGHAGSSANTVVGRHVELRAEGNIVYAEGADDMIVMLGVKNLVVVKFGNTVLLAQKDSLQDLKAVLTDERLAAPAVA